MDNARINYATANYRESWIHHPVIGDPSFDAFEREPGNPIYVGQPPFPWTVNGSLFQDPRSGIWYGYIGLYPVGYWPSGGCLLLKEEAPQHWVRKGLILQGDSTTFDAEAGQAGGTPDVYLVCESGKYHMVYDWANRSNTRGGLAYAWAESPEGPFHRHPIPIHLDTDQPLLKDRYQRVYAACLFKRAADWLIIAMMSTPRNAGGAWALIAMVANRPEGPYSPPIFLLAPELDVFYPTPIEFYPCFVHDGYIYAPATSVAKNRTFQIIYRVTIERAHEPEVWELFQCGSIWHDLVNINSERGIWGQTFSGQIIMDAAQNVEIFRVISFSLTHSNQGAVFVSQRPWNRPNRDGFWLSGPYAPSVAILAQNYADFDLSVELIPRGEWAIRWHVNTPCGSNRLGADGQLATKKQGQYMEWHFTNSICELIQWGKLRKRVLFRGSIHHDKTLLSLHISCHQNRLRLLSENHILYERKITESIPEGRMELWAGLGCLLDVSRFEITGDANSAWITWLPVEGLLGAGETQNRLIRGNTPVNRLKWNLYGSQFHIPLNSTKHAATVELVVDGKFITTLSLEKRSLRQSPQFHEIAVPLGYHSLVLRQKSGILLPLSLKSRAFSK